MFDFDAFLNSIKYLDTEDILTTAYKQHKTLDKASTRFTTAARLDLQHSIAGLLFWIETKQRPPNMSDRDFAKLKPLCENLIKKGQLEPVVLDLFTDVSETT